jgi:hypothetical protein
MASYKDLIVNGPPTARYVLLSDLIDILSQRAILLQKQGMEPGFGNEAMNLLRGSYSEIQAILQRLQNENS